MKKLGLFSLVFILCCIWSGANNILYAEGTTYNITHKELVINVGSTEEPIMPQSTDNVYYVNDKVFVADTVSKNVYLKTDMETKAIYYNAEITPYDMVLLQNGKLLISSKNSSVRIFNTISNQEETPISTYIFENDDEEYTIPAEQKIAHSAFDDVYFIQGNNILKYNPSLTVLEHFLTLTYNESALNFTNGAFFVNEDNTTLYLTIANKIYSIDVATKAISEVQTINTYNNIKTLIADNLGNIYILDNNTLYKENATGVTSIVLDKTANDIDIDLITGKIYIADTNNQVYKTTIQDTTKKNFVDNYADQPLPVDLKTISTKDTAVKIVETKSAITPLYTYKSLIKISKEYQTSKKLIVLDESDSKFYYVYDNNSSTQAGYQTGFILKSNCLLVDSTFPAEFAEKHTAKVIVNESKLYTIPSSVTIDTENRAPSIINVKYGEIVTVISAPQASTDTNGVNFVAISYVKYGTPVVGYLDSRTLISTTYDTLANTPIPNATTRAETTIYKEASCETEIEVLPQNSNVKIIKSENGVSEIEYFVNEGENQYIKSGYVKTSFLNDGSLTTIQIVGIILMFAAIIFAILIAIIIHKHRKKENPLN